MVIEKGKRSDMTELRAGIIKIRVGILIILLCSLTAIAGANTENQQEENKGKTYVLVVGGISKEPENITARTKDITVIQTFFLVHAAVAAENITILTAENSRSGSTEANLRKTLDKLKTAVQPGDRFIFYYIGLANAVGGELRFNLPGTDITQIQLAQLLEQINVSSMLVVLDCPFSGMAVKALTKTGRIIICSCTDQQQYSTRFSRYFIPALTDKGSDTNANGKVSVLEAFTQAVKKIEQWYQQNKLLITEIPQLEDNADGRPSKEPWKYEIDKMDGLAASQFFLSGKL
jgi:hypothetical protein